MSNLDRKFDSKISSMGGGGGGGGSKLIICIIFHSIAIELLWLVWYIHCMTTFNDHMTQTTASLYRFWFVSSSLFY